jgi:hypothetical protein
MCSWSFFFTTSRGKKNVVTVPEFEGRDAEMHMRKDRGRAVLLAQLWSITLHVCAAAFTLFAAAPKEGRVTVQGRHELW